MNRVWMSVAVVVTLAGLAQTYRSVSWAQETDDSSDAAAKYDVQYAETYVKLTSARLRQAEGLNKRVPGTVSKADMSDLRGNSELAQQLMTSTQQGERRGRPSVFLRLGQLAVARAERNLAQAKAIKSRTNNFVSDIDIEILELRLQMSRLQLASGKEAMSRSSDDELEWKIGLLYEEVIRLRDEVGRLKQRS